MTSSKLWMLGGVVLAQVWWTPPAAAGVGPVNSIPVPSYPYAVAVDGSSDRVFAISRSYNDKLTAIDAGSGEIVATVRAEPEPTDVAVDPDRAEVYVVSSGNEYGVGSLQIFRAQDLSLLAVVPVGRLPGGIAVSPATGLVYVANGGDGTISAVDPTTRSVVGTESLGFRPWQLAADPHAPFLFATGTEDHLSRVAAIDARTLKVVSVEACCRGWKLAVNPDSGLLYVANFFCSCEGALHVFDTTDGRLTPLREIPVPGNPSDVEVDVSTDRIWVTLADRDKVAAFDSRSETLLELADGGRLPFSVSAHPRTGVPYVVSFSDSAISVIGEEFAPPTTFIDTPDLAMLRTGDNVTGRAADEVSGIRSVEVMIEKLGGNTRSASVIPTCIHPNKRSCTWTSQQICLCEVGIYTVRARATDRASNIDPTEQRITVIVRAGPVS